MGVFLVGIVSNLFREDHAVHGEDQYGLFPEDITHGDQKAYMLFSTIGGVAFSLRRIRSCTPHSINVFRLYVRVVTDVLWRDPAVP
jgi:hypothetical protein